MDKKPLSRKPLVQFGANPLLTTPAAKQLTPDSPAMSVLTDFSQVMPQSIAGDKPHRSFLFPILYSLTP